MKTETVTVLRDLCEEVVSLRQSSSDLKRVLDQALSDHKAAEESLLNDEESLNGLREKEATLMNANAELNAELRQAIEERDDARRKLGEWARFVNFGVYEPLNKFQFKRKATEANLNACANLIETVCAALEKFQMEHPITLIEDRKAK